jgi:WD40 repeat protein
MQSINILIYVSLIIIGVIAAAILGVLADWILKKYLPEKPTSRHLGIAAIIIFILIVSSACPAIYEYYGAAVPNLLPTPSQTNVTISFASITPHPPITNLTPSSESKTPTSIPIDTPTKVPPTKVKETQVIPTSISPAEKAIPYDSFVKHPSLSAHSGEVFALDFTKNGHILASGGGDTKIRLWDLDNNIPNKTLTGNRASVISLSFSPDGTELVSGSSSSTLLLWNTNNGKIIKTLSGDDSSALFISDDSLISLSSHADLTYWNTKNSGKVYSVNAGYFTCNSNVSASVAERKVVTISCTDIFLFDIPTGNGGKTNMQSPGTYYLKGEISPDGKYLITTSPNDGSVILWDIETESIISTLQLSGVSALAFSPDSKSFACGSWKGEVSLWDTEGKPIITFQASTRVNDIAFSYDGAIIAAATANGTIDIWGNNR